MKIVLDRISLIEVIFVLILDFRLKFDSVVFINSVKLDSYGSVVSNLLNGIFEKVGLFIFVVSSFLVY